MMKPRECQRGGSSMFARVSTIAITVAPSRLKPKSTPTSTSMNCRSVTGDLPVKKARFPLSRHIEPSGAAVVDEIHQVFQQLRHNPVNVALVPIESLRVSQ